jgi:hypothetical protein
MSTPTKIAKVQWCGNLVRVYDEEHPERDLFCYGTSTSDLITAIRSKAAQLGYSVPQIYAGKDNIVRIWF